METKMDTTMEVARDTTMEMMVPKKKGISGSTLKMIAIITMLIDHVGAVLVGRLFIVYGYFEAVNAGDMHTILQWMQNNALLYYGYTVMRMIGRIAFPIFIFLMIEGFDKTSNRWKYAMRLGVFAVISEIPFDLAFHARFLEFTYQNVFFTLFIGLLLMILIDAIDHRQMPVFLKVILEGVSIALAAAVAEFLQTDYGAIGIVCIVVMFLFRKHKVGQIVAGCVTFLWEVPAPLAFIPIAFYNGKRGWKLKYVFYAFYPLHLLVIYLICLAMGIHGYAVV